MAVLVAAAVLLLFVGSGVVVATGITVLSGAGVFIVGAGVVALVEILEAIQYHI